MIGYGNYQRIPLKRISLCLIAFLLLASFVSAQTDEAVAGLTPDSPLYFIDVWWDNQKISNMDTYEKDKERIEIDYEKVFHN